MVSVGHGGIAGLGALTVPLTPGDLQVLGSAEPADHGLGDTLGSPGQSPALGSLPHFMALGGIKLITSVLSHSVLPSMSQPLLQGLEGLSTFMKQHSHCRHNNNGSVTQNSSLNHRSHVFLQTFRLRCGSLSSQSGLRARGNAAAQCVQPGAGELLLSSGCWC